MTKILNGSCHICNEKGLLYPAKKKGEEIKICYSCRERARRFQGI